MPDPHQRADAPPRPAREEPDAPAPGLRPLGGRAARRFAAAAAIALTLLVVWSSHRTWDVAVVRRPGYANLVHLLVYGGLGGLWALAAGIAAAATRAAAGRAAALGVTIAALTGLADEIHQAFVPGRSCSAFDVLVDACGAATAALLLRALVERRLGDAVLHTRTLALAVIGVWAALRGTAVAPAVDLALSGLLGRP